MNLAFPSGGRSLKDMKNLEWIFIGIHWLGVPALVAIGITYQPVVFQAGHHQPLRRHPAQAGAPAVSMPACPAK